jgi:hypothetical protein
MEALPLVGAFISSSGASDAADAQQAGTAAATAEQRRQFDLVRGDTASARGIGESAIAQLARELGLPYNPQTGSSLSEAQIRAELTPQFTTPGVPANMPQGGQITYGPEGNNQNQNWTQGTPASVNQAGLDAAVRQRLAQQGAQQPGQPMPQEVIDPTKEPGYQFGLQQGQTALDRRIAAMGGRVSGAALKASTRYNQDYATSGYAAAYNRQNSARSERLNRLQALAGFGQTAAATSGQVGAQTSNAISNMLTSQGDATGASKIAQGNIWGNAFNQVAANYKPQTPSYINPMTGYGYGLGANYDK